MTRKKAKVLIIIVVSIVAVVFLTWFFRLSDVGFTPEMAAKVKYSDFTYSHSDAGEIDLFYIEEGMGNIKYRSTFVGVERKGLLYQVMDDSYMYECYSGQEPACYLQVFIKDGKCYNCLVIDTFLHPDYMMQIKEVVCGGKTYELTDGVYFVTDYMVTEFSVGEHNILVRTH